MGCVQVNPRLGSLERLSWGPLLVRPAIIPPQRYRRDASSWHDHACLPPAHPNLLRCDTSIRCNTSHHALLPASISAPAPCRALTPLRTHARSRLPPAVRPTRSESSLPDPRTRRATTTPAATRADSSRRTRTARASSSSPRRPRGAGSPSRASRSRTWATRRCSARTTPAALSTRPTGRTPSPSATRQCRTCARQARQDQTTSSAGRCTMDLLAHSLPFLQGQPGTPISSALARWQQ